MDRQIGRCRCTPPPVVAGAAETGSQSDRQRDRQSVRYIERQTARLIYRYRYIDIDI